MFEFTDLSYLFHKKFTLNHIHKALFTEFILTLSAFRYYFSFDFLFTFWTRCVQRTWVHGMLSVILATFIKAFNLKFEIVFSFEFFFVFLEQKTFTIVFLDYLLKLDVASVFFELFTAIRSKFELCVGHLLWLISVTVLALDSNLVTFCS